MNRLTLGNTGIQVSPLGFGAMRLPLLRSNSAQALDLSKKLIRTSLNSGINYFDTGYDYHSEDLLGEVLSQYRRSDYVLTTKLPLVYLESHGTQSQVDTIINDQFDKLKIDHLDCYLLHNIKLAQLEMIESLGIIKTLESFKRQGRVNYIGFSTHERDLQSIIKISKLTKWDLVQYQVNYYDWYTLPSTSQIVDWFTSSELPIIVMEPLLGGNLANLANYDLILDSKSFIELAFRWIHTQLPNSLILSGMTSLNQIRENSDIFRTIQPLTDSELVGVNELVHAINLKNLSRCTSCNYCECSQGVQISRILSSYDTYQKFGNYDELLRVSQQLQKSGGSYNSCTKCYKCVDRCPQHIDILGRFSEVSQLIKERGN